MSRKNRNKSNRPQQIAEAATTDDNAQQIPNAMVRSAMNSPQFMPLSNQYTSPRRGARELLKLYGEAPWLRAIVGKISRAVAETDWKLYAKKGKNGRFIKHQRLAAKSFVRDVDLNELTPIENHPLFTLLERGTGNPRLNGYAVLQVTQEHMDTVGEAYWLIERDSLGVPGAVWPLPPPWVNALPTEKSPFYQLNMPGGTKVDIPVTEIIPFIDPDPSNPYGRGLSTAQTLDDEIQIDEFAAKHQKSFFLNRARPDVIISGQFISKSDAERLERQWMSDHQGFWKAFKPLFFSQKIDVKEISQTFESMQMVQVRKQERDTFIQAFGVPPEKFGIVNESKRSTIAAADYFWSKDVIKPRVEAIRRILQQVLVPMFDERLILYYDTPVIQDDEHQLAVMSKAPWSVTINEWRKAAGLRSLGQAGETLVVPRNMQAVALTDENGVPVNVIETPGPNKPADTDDDKPDDDDEDEDDKKYFEYAFEQGLLESEVAAGVADAIKQVFESKG